METLGKEPREITIIENEIFSRFNEKREQEKGIINKITYMCKINFWNRSTLKKVMDQQLLELLDISEKISEKKIIIIENIKKNLEIILEVFEGSRKTFYTVFWENKELVEEIEMQINLQMIELKEKTEKAITWIDWFEAKTKWLEWYVWDFYEYCNDIGTLETLKEYLIKRDELYMIMVEYMNLRNNFKKGIEYVNKHMNEKRK